MIHAFDQNLESLFTVDDHRIGRFGLVLVGHAQGRALRDICDIGQAQFAYHFWGRLRQTKQI